MMCYDTVCVLQYTILLFAILTAEIVTVTFLAVLRDKVNSSRVFIKCNLLLLLLIIADTFIFERLFLVKQRNRISTQ